MVQSRMRLLGNSMDNSIKTNFNHTVRKGCSMVLLLVNGPNQAARSSPAYLLH